MLSAKMAAVQTSTRVMDRVASEVCGVLIGGI